ncbi:beta-1,3-galactosyltransferase brn [Lingula anatina]|uniref:Hexosyltransferase n=1 Tax=Lingula anatina TaxID=7574 RepID=A0A1S3HNZ8_LINAN|nr:beta-1,3-galactosyltransferase brn [Lingula anatina]|eukprot:XP_013387755.1 beta-1,3-galactosyltransferase brn [Lingula anatina]
MVYLRNRILRSVMLFRRNSRVLAALAVGIIVIMVHYREHFPQINITYFKENEWIEEDFADLYTREERQYEREGRVDASQSKGTEKKSSKVKWAPLSTDSSVRTEPPSNKYESTVGETPQADNVSKENSNELPPCNFCIRNFREKDPNYRLDEQKAAELQCRALTCLPPPEYYIPRPKPINGFEYYTMILSPKGVCSDKESRILIVVHTKVTGAGIRSLWRRVTKPFLKAHPQFRILFMVGYTADTAAWKATENEGKQNNDIIGYSFIDSYHNLPLKTAMMLRWCTENCQNLEYLIKIDDDMFFNPKKLLQVLRKFSNQLVIVGRLNFHHEVRRDPSDSIYVPYEQYPYHFWPNFQGGGLYVVSGKAVPKLWAVAPYIPVVNLEDAWVTTLAIATGVERQLTRDFTNRRPERWVDKLKNTICATAEKQVGYLMTGRAKMDIEKIWYECRNASAV